MPPSEKLVTSSQSMTREQLAEFLEGIAARVRDGEVTLTSGPDTAVLDLPEEMRVDVEATSAQKSRGTKMELEIEIEWYPDAPAESSIELG